MTIKQQLRAAFSILAFCAGAAMAQGAAAPIPVEAFFHNPAFADGRLSPNGRHVAIKVTPKGARTQLVILDAQTLAAKAIASPTDVNIEEVHWVNDDRLVFTVHDDETAPGDTRLGTGLFAVSRDGTDFRQLVDRGGWGSRTLTASARLLHGNTWFAATTRDKQSDDIFVVQPYWNNRWEFEALNVLRLNTRTAIAVPYPRPANSYSWLIDSANVPRVTATYESGMVSVYHLGQADGKWTRLAEYDPLSSNGVEPVGLGPDGSLYVASSNGGDTKALYRFDIEKKRLDAEPIISLKGFDFDGQLVMDKSALLGVRYRSDARGTVWFDPRWKAVQAKIDALLPNTVNIVDVPLRGEVPYVLVRAFSDVDPGRFLLFNTETSRLTVLGMVERDIDARRMAPRDLVRYKARDGLEIPAWLTVPKGGKGKKLPMVVLVHGGPWVRGGEWKWDNETQFLASRGYVVLEPEFRGSTGFGVRHFNAGWKQWGLAMQNDIADGVRWAIQQGIVDPERICIAGASYGGYSTLMGLANDPDLFKCGVNWVGVTDLSLLYDHAWSGASEASRTYGMPRLVGDPEKDAEQIRKTSPVNLADRIKQPLFMAYGSSDRRVPPMHGARMRDALAKHNKHVEWIEYPDEGHGWGLVQNRVDFWTRVEKFLEKNIGAK
ncbi:MAG: prolyl oligopeptidase family serine peptidase [Ramlibacter sp.]